mgnify:CR=1 FL=1
MIKKKQLSFDKELFKRSVEYNVRTMYRREMGEATKEQVFQAAAYALKDQIVDDWMRTQKEFEEKNPKTLYYLSMEFLMGRAFGNNLINLQAYEPVAEALNELGFDINAIEDQEPDPALGNGGLGRLAACFLDSLATLNYPAYGCGIRYRLLYGRARNGQLSDLRFLHKIRIRAFQTENRRRLSGGSSGQLAGERKSV